MVAESRPGVKEGTPSLLCGVFLGDGDPAAAGVDVLRSAAERRRWLWMQGTLRSSILRERRRDPNTQSGTTAAGGSHEDRPLRRTTLLRMEGQRRTLGELGPPR
jgi:hypothetical protein